MSPRSTLLLTAALPVVALGVALSAGPAAAAPGNANSFLIDLGCSNGQHYTISVVEPSADQSAGHLVAQPGVLIPTAFQFDVTVLDEAGAVVDQFSYSRRPGPWTLRGPPRRDDVHVLPDRDRRRARRQCADHPARRHRARLPAPLTSAPTSTGLSRSDIRCTGVTVAHWATHAGNTKSTKPGVWPVFVDCRVLDGSYRCRGVREFLLEHGNRSAARRRPAAESVRRRERSSARSQRRRGPRRRAVRAERRARHPPCARRARAHPRRPTDRPGCARPSRRPRPARCRCRGRRRWPRAPR